MSSRREKRGFTLVELVVAVGLLAMIFSFSGVIFKVCIKSHRMAVANAEIMQKFRVITDQINADFKGIREDAPFVVDFDRRHDCNDKILFFADGDFRSVQQYRPASAPGTSVPNTVGLQIAGNVARIRYGLAAQVSVAGGLDSPTDPPPQKRILARQQNILTNDADLQQWPLVADMNSLLARNMQYPITQESLCRDRYEHDSMSLSQWQSLSLVAWNSIVLRAFTEEPPSVNLNDPVTFHKIWSEGVSDFRIEWSYRDVDPSGISVLCWFPSKDPDGMGNFPPHIPRPNGLSRFGVRFNFPVGAYWNRTWPIWDVNYNATQRFAADFLPEALRFTFTIHDSHGVYPEGRIFTHIVYLGDRVGN